MDRRKQEVTRQQKNLTPSEVALRGGLLVNSVDIHQSLQLLYHTQKVLSSTDKNILRLLFGVVYYKHDYAVGGVVIRPADVQAHIVLGADFVDNIVEVGLAARICLFQL